jgi:hypothetical protein
MQQDSTEKKLCLTGNSAVCKIYCEVSGTRKCRIVKGAAGKYCSEDCICIFQRPWRLFPLRQVYLKCFLLRQHYLYTHVGASAVECQKIVLRIYFTLLRNNLFCFASFVFKRLFYLSFYLVLFIYFSIHFAFSLSTGSQNFLYMFNYSNSWM